MTTLRSRALEAAPLVAFITLLSLSACSDSGPGAPQTEEKYPAKGQSIAVNPPLAEILETGQRIQLSADVRDALGKQVTNARVTWEALDPAVATVDYAGTVTGMNEGVAEIRGTYAGVSATAVVAVSRPRNKEGTSGASGGASVTVYPDSDTIPLVGGSVKLLAIARSPSGKLFGANKLSWSSTDQTVATVTRDGVVTASKSGATKVIAAFEGAADTSQIWVAPSNVAAKIAVAPKADTIPSVGGTVTLTGRVLNGSGLEIAGLDVGWTSLDPSIATVKMGVVQGVKKGVVKIVGRHKALEDTATVWVAPVMPATSIYVTPKTDTIPQLGGTVTLSATLLDGSGATLSQAVTWGTLDPLIASVTQAGVVRGAKAGVARITAKYNALVDTARIWVAPAPPKPAHVVTLSPASDSVEIGKTVALVATVRDTSGTEKTTALATWTSLDATIATVSEAGPVRGVDVKGVKEGTAKIVALYGGVADTAVVMVTPAGSGDGDGSGGGSGGGGSSSGYTTKFTPRTAYIANAGDETRIIWDVYDSTGHEIAKVYATWTSLDPTVATVPPGPSRAADIRGVSKGTAKIIAEWNGTVDTATVVVENGTAGSGGSGSGSAWIQVTPALDTIAAVGGNTQLSVAAKDTAGNPVSSGAVSWNSLDAAIASVNGGMVVGYAKGTARITATYAGVADTSWVMVAPAPPPAPGSQLTPSALLPLLGSLVARDPNTSLQALRTYDQRYTQNEYARFQDYLAVEYDPQGAYLNANHYGGLRSRLSWAIRTGEAWGAGVTDESKYGYARGVRIVRRYLQWSEKNTYNIPVQNNTGIADIELLYRLHGDPVALTHIHMTAQKYTLDPYGYLTLQNPASGARIPAVAMQAFNAAHRLGIPYARNYANPNIALDQTISSWRQAGERLIAWFDQYNVIQADGTIYSPSNHGDTYFMDAMLATQLLEWCANVQWHPRAFELARLIMDNLVSSLKPGWSSLGYLNTSTSPSDDLAGFYIWPSLVMWQETGDMKYYDFAMKNLAAAAKGYIFAPKQFNQVYSTLGQDLEALIAGVSWR
jgi:uncharacterized protein YjdB